MTQFFSTYRQSLFIVVGLFSLSLPTFHQLAAQPEESTPVRSFRNFDRRNSPGLPQSTVGALYQDKQGILWIATLDGLAFFDGTSIQPVADQPNAPVRGSLGSIAARRAGGLYVGGSTAVYIFDGATWNAVPTLGMSRSLAEDETGVLWRVDTSRGVRTLDLSQALAQPPPWTSPTLPVDIGLAIGVHATENTLWLAGKNGVARRQDGEWQAIAGGPAPSAITAFLPISDGTCWIGTRSGQVFHARPGEAAWRREDIPNWRGGWIRTFEEDRRGRIWFAGNEGQVAHGNAGRPWTLWNDNNGLHPEDRVVIFADREGTMWFAANGHGLQQWVGEAWSHRNLWLSDRLPERRALAFGISGTHQGGFLAAVFNRGIWYWDGQEMHQYGKAEGLAEDVRMAIEPEPNVLWVGVRFGIFESQNGSRFRQVAEVPNGFVYDFHRSPNGDWYASTSADGIYQLTPAGWRPATHFNQHLPNLNVRDLVWRSNGELWAATLGGIVAFDGEPLQPTVLPSDVDGPVGVNVLLEVEDEIWIGDFHGIRIWSDGSSRPIASRRITTENGAPGRTVYSLVQSPDKAIWAGGSHGVTRFSAPDSSGRRDWQRFDASDGLIEVECNLNGLWPEANGSILVGTMASLARFDSSIKPLAPANLEVHWRERPTPNADGMAHLPASRRSVHLAWIAPWMAPKPVEYRVRIPRMRPDWFDAQSEPSRALENLGPGDWRIEVAARFKGESQWTAPINSKFRIAPYFWETLWFYGLIAVALALAVVATIRLRTLRLARRAQELERAVREQVDQIKVLGGLLPICSGCKKVRDDAGYWLQIEKYVSKHSEAEFSHGLCPGCLIEMYPDYVDEDDEDDQLPMSNRRPP